MRAEAFVAAARGFIGVPWVHQGRSERGVDCVGLIVLSARAIGIDAPMKADYGRFQYYPQAREYLEQFCDRVGSPELGDIVLYKTTQSLHMAIVSEVEDGGIARVIQALGHKSSVVDTALQFTPLQLWRLRWPS
ncbi:peptidoglycan endopeptidase [Mesorhizobium sp. M2D.F.Ca.ET.232.01.1.1]|uniref:NlpC/P60 family protein n=1 Tax=Mesorhizobium sp. M2D.F.Ca.ET.232.01.1.1 TaxID=2496670 RepID=UPI000FCB7838|nr:NlpC/P60 family protein [Mesorhizobium sp. M2D.F.Ca.ET.232.01.1.1]TGP28196.1 peptidoglycan endopeptidase [Mesorhizobium sp. M2D.F.Ca.ET.232.01.1.1]